MLRVTGLRRYYPSGPEILESGLISRRWKNWTTPKKHRLLLTGVVGFHMKNFVHNDNGVLSLVPFS